MNFKGVVELNLSHLPLKSSGSHLQAIIPTKVELHRTANPNPAVNNIYPYISDDVVR